YLPDELPVPVNYRDLKPSNIMIDGQEQVRLIDFGIARDFKSGRQADTVQIGTGGFAAPEQFQQTQTNRRTNLYSLGAVLYYLLSGG
ncbi:protein kinase, partial [Paenibacillus sp. GbtcB18]|uniref:protein kinase domain-containing protein n=1 Tax=Paenibacillus sp. GbtcB18 TaxID=2824763 RepID=UPI001C302F6C